MRGDPLQAPVRRRRIDLLENGGPEFLLKERLVGLISAELWRKMHENKVCDFSHPSDAEAGEPLHPREERGKTVACRVVLSWRSSC
jgi:hypothetical protein